MSITADSRDRAVTILDRWYYLTGVPQTDPPGAKAWMAYGRCGDADPDLFFPTRADSEQTYQAQALCGRCPVRERCLRDALDRPATGVRWGVRGGVYFDTSGRAAPLCRTLGCLNYRLHGKKTCSGCTAVAAPVATADREAAVA